MSSGSSVSGASGNGGELDELGWELDRRVGRVHEQRQRELPLEPLRGEEVDELTGFVGRVGPVEDAGELDLAEARRRHHRRRRVGARRIGEDHLGRRARRVADHQRSWPAARPREALVVGLGPPVDHLDPVGRQRRPVVAPPVAVGGDRRQQERQTRRRRRRVLDDEQVGVVGVDQVVEVSRWVELVLVEPADVVVDAHVAVVDRRRLEAGDETTQLGRHRRRASVTRTARTHRRRGPATGRCCRHPTSRHLRGCRP